MAGIAGAAFESAVDMLGAVDEYVGVAVTDRIDVTVATAGCTDSHRSRRKACRNGYCGVTGRGWWRETMTSSATCHRENRRQIIGVAPGGGSVGSARITTRHGATMAVNV